MFSKLHQKFINNFSTGWRKLLTKGIFVKTKTTVIHGIPEDSPQSMKPCMNKLVRIATNLIIANIDLIAKMLEE